VSRQAIAEKNIDGAAPVDKHALESDAVDLGVQDQGKTPWLWDCGPLILPVEGDLSVRPRREFWVSDQAVCAVHVEAGSLQELSFSFRLYGNFASEDGVYHVGGTDVLVSWVPILVVVFVFVTMSVLLPVFLDGIPLSSLLCVDAYEDTTFFHCVIGHGMELAWTFQRLVVVFLVVSPSIGALNCVHLVVVVTRSLATEIIAVVASPVPTCSVVAVVATAGVPVVEASAAVVSSGRLVGTSRIFSDEFFGVIGISVVFGRGEEFGDRGRSFAQ